MLPILVPLFALALGPEIPLGSTRITSAPYNQTLSSVASNGRDFLALWSDQRNTLDPNQPPRFPALYDGRIDASGQPVNPTGHKLFDSAVGKMTWTGSSYMLVYTPSVTNDSLFLQRLDDDGNLKDHAVPIAVTGAPVWLASNGNNLLLVTNTLQYNVSLVTLLGIDGAVVHTTSMEMDRATNRVFTLPGGDYGFVAIHSNGCGGFACTHTVSLYTVNAHDGNIAETDLYDVSMYANVAAVASDDRILVALEDEDQSPYWSASYEVIHEDGGVLAPKTILESGVPPSISGFNGPTVGWDGREFLVLAQNPTAAAAHAFRVAADGTQIDATPVVLNDVQWDDGALPMFASSSDTQLLAWDAVTDVFARGAPAFDELAAAPTHDVTLAPALQLFPTLAAGGVAAWIENAVVRGEDIGKADREIINRPTSEVSAPAIAQGENGDLVVWRTTWPLQVVGQRVASDGSPVGNSFVIATRQPQNPQISASDDLSVAWDGHDFLVSWTADGVYAARVSESGDVLDSQPLVLSSVESTDDLITPRIISTGNGFLVVWIDQKYIFTLGPIPIPPTSTVYAARIGDSGSVTPIGALWDGGDVDELVLARVSDGRIAAMWRDWNDTPNWKCINRMLLNEDGTAASDVAPIVCCTASLYAPAIGGFDAAWDGNKLVVAWQEQPGQTITALRIDPFTLAGFDEPVQVNPLGTQAAAPSVVANGTGVTIAYQRLADVSRVFARNLIVNAAPRRRTSR